jgi:outer membrane receptor protein involved in Fe transport
VSHFTLVFNAALIKSVVDLGENAYAYSSSRPMQGQSPYIINTGIYYQNDSAALGISLLYNSMGERIVFVGDPENPDVYEMPRHQLDLSINKRFGKHLQVKLGLKDLLNQPVVYQQIIRVSNNKEVKEISQITQKYRPGSIFTAGVSINF